MATICTDYLLREPNYFIFGRNERFTSKPLLAIFISFGYRACRSGGVLFGG